MLSIVCMHKIHAQEHRSRQPVIPGTANAEVCILNHDSILSGIVSFPISLTKRFEILNQQRTGQVITA